MTAFVPLQTFAAFGTAHLLLLAATVVGMVAFAWLGRRCRDSRWSGIIGRGLAIVLLIPAVAFTVFWLLPDNFELGQSLPLHFSDVLRFLTPYALWTRRRWAVAVVYYWGLTFNPQALITPDLHLGAHPVLEFTSYWSQHIIVMWAVAFLTWGLRLTPAWRDYRRTLLITLGWAVVAFGVNAALGTNYGYVSRKPGGASLLDLMGDWPLYLLVILAGVIIVWAAITWPWTHLAARRKSIT